jgi:hypothetical protein
MDNWRNFYLRSSLTYIPFLAHLVFRPCELLPSLFVRRPSVNIAHFNLLLRNHWANCNQTSILEVGITGHNFQGGPPKDHSTKVWLQLAQWFLRRRLKCAMLTDGRRTKSDGNSSHGLKTRWAKNGNRWTKLNQTWQGWSPWVGPFQNCVLQPRPPFKMADVVKNRNFFNCPLLI